MAPETTVCYSTKFCDLKFYHKVYVSDTEACQGLHLFPVCDVILFPSRMSYKATKPGFSFCVNFMLSYAFVMRACLIWLY